jgi:hypothetical protein
LKVPLRSVCFLACLTLAAVGAWSGAWAGGGINDEPHEHNEDDGPTYFGFVKDPRGTPVSTAKVTVKIKNGIAYVMHTDKLGLYKLRGLGKLVNPDDVMISCAKDGYRQTRIFRRPLPKGKPVKSVETECRLELDKS